MTTSKTRHPACSQVACPRAKTKSTAVGIWKRAPRDTGSRLATKSDTSMAINTDHQVTSTRVTHRVAAATPTAVVRMRWMESPKVLHGDDEITSKVVRGAKMPKELGEIQ